MSGEETKYKDVELNEEHVEKHQKKMFAPASTKKESEEESSTLRLVTFVCVMVLLVFAIATLAVAVNNVDDDSDDGSSNDDTTTTSTDWSYDGTTGPEYWGSLLDDYDTCDSGTEQSPINVPLTESGYEGTIYPASDALSFATMVSLNAATFTVSQTEAGAKFSCQDATTGGCGSLTAQDGTEFYLNQVHFHAPAEHTIDQQHYPIGAHLVFESASEDDTTYNVIEVLFDATLGDDDDDTEATELVDELWNYIDSDGDAETSSIDFGQIVTDSGFYQYNGSFTTPPCTEGVTWRIQADVQSMRESQFLQFWEQVGGYPGTARDVQPLNARSIEYNVDIKYAWEGQFGPDYWGDLKTSWAACGTGTSQSPIDIPFESAGLNTTDTTGTPLTDMIETETTEWAVTQSYSAPVFSCPNLGDCGTLEYGGITYNLAQFHFHSPSENTVDTTHYGLEMHMVHCDGSCVVGTDNFAVIGVLFTGGLEESESSDANTFISDAWDYLSSDGVSMSSGINIEDIMSSASGYFAFSGSLTTPPCTEGLQWLVQAEHNPIKTSLIEAYWSQIGEYPGNSRPTQPLNSRTITYSFD